MAKDPMPPKKRLLEGERVVTYLRRRRLENVLTLAFFLAVVLLFLSGYLQWPDNRRKAIFAAVIVAAVPIGVAVNTHYWMTDRRILRSVAGVLTAWPLEGLTPRATKGRLANDDVRFERADGAPVLVVRSVDNAPKVLAEHVNLKNAPAATEGADAPGAADAERATS